MRSCHHFHSDGLEIQIGENTYLIEVDADAVSTSIAGSCYSPDGSPGNPDEYDFEIQRIDATWMKYDGDNLIEAEPSAHMESCLEELLYEIDWRD